MPPIPSIRSTLAALTGRPPDDHEVDAVVEEIDHAVNARVNEAIGKIQPRLIAQARRSVQGIGALTLLSLGLNAWLFTHPGLTAEEVDREINTSGLAAMVTDFETRASNFLTAEEIDTKIAAIPLPTISTEIYFAAAYLEKADPDGDDVKGAADRCPDIVGVRQDGLNGCPAAADDDGDGVDNAFDFCPATPAEEKGKVINAFGDVAWIFNVDVEKAVNNNGCTDANGDGFADARLAMLASTACAEMTLTEKKPASAEGANDDEGTAKYSGCVVDNMNDQEITCRYVGQAVVDCKMTISG